MVKGIKRFIVIVLAAFLVFSQVYTAYADTESGEQDNLDSYTELKMNEFDASLVEKKINNLNSNGLDNTIYGPDDIVRVSIIIDKPGVIEKGYNPNKINSRYQALSYRKELRNIQDDVIKHIEKGLGISVDVKGYLTLAMNAISVDIRYSDINDILQIPNVKSVEFENMYFAQALTEDNVDPHIYNTADTYDHIVDADYAWERGYTGAGKRIAIIDTGLDITHISFNNHAFDYSIGLIDPDGTKYHLMDNNDLTYYKNNYPLNSGQEAEYYNSKIPYIYNYAQNNTIVDHSLNGVSNHGSHVAGIAAANRYILVNEVETPDQGNGTYKDEDGGIHYAIFNDAASTVKAVGMAPDAQILAMNVFEYDYRYNDSVTYDGWVMLAIEDAIYLECDAINLSLGSICGQTYNNTYQKAFDMLASGQYGDGSTIFSVSAGNSTTISYVEGTNLLIKDIRNGTIGEPSSYINMLSVASSDKVASLVSYTSSQPSYYSSWGPNSSLLLKPEVTAPGNDIYSVIGNTCASGHCPIIHDDYGKKSGTSMAAPHVAGLSVLVNQYLHELNLSEINSLLFEKYSYRAIIQSMLMSTATPLRSGYYHPVIQQGAGLINVEDALKSKVVIMMSESDNTLTAKTGAALDGKVKAEIGDDPSKKGIYSFTFRIYNISGEDVLFEDPSTAVFTQRTVINGGQLCLSANTINAGKQIDFIWAKEKIDVNNDGYTNYADVQTILEYLAGNIDDTQINIEVADIDKDNTITSYDAQLLIDSFNGETSVKPHDYADVTVTFDFYASDDYINGAYIEGFTFLAESNEESEESLTYSIPILGFYGDFNDASMFANDDYIDSLYGNGDHKYFKELEYQYLEIQYGNNDQVMFSGNPYIVEKSYPSNKFAVSSSTLISGFYPVLLSSAGTYKTFIARIADYGGSIEDVLLVKNSNVRVGYQLSAAIQTEIKNLYLNDGDHIRIGFYAIPEYYAMTLNDSNGLQMNSANAGYINDDCFVELLKNNDLYDSFYSGYDFIIDNEAPQIISCYLDEANKKLYIDLKDNHNLAYASVMPFDLTSIIYETAIDGKSATVAVDISEALENGSGTIVVYAGDYAKNGSAVVVEISDNPSISTELFGFAADSEGNSYKIRFNTSDVASYEVLDSYDKTIIAVTNLLNEDNSIDTFALDENNDIYIVKEHLEYQSHLDGDAYSITAPPMLYYSDHHLVLSVFDSEINLLNCDTGEIVDTCYPGHYTQNNDLYAITSEVLISDELLIHAFALDEAGNIWKFSYWYRDERLTLEEQPIYYDGFTKICATGIHPSSSDDLYYDGHYIYWVNNYGSSELIVIDPSNGLFADLGCFGDDLKLLTIYENQKLPGCEYSNNIESIELPWSNLKMSVGAQKRFEAITTPQYVFDTTVSWSSSNPLVASVDENGLVTALKPGHTTIVCEKYVPDKGVLSCECDVEVIEIDRYLDVVVHDGLFGSAYLSILDTSNTSVLDIIDYQESNDISIFYATSYYYLDEIVTVCLDEAGGVYLLDSNNHLNRVGEYDFTWGTSPLCNTVGIPVMYQKKYERAVNMFYACPDLVVSKLIGSGTQDVEISPYNSDSTLEELFSFSIAVRYDTPLSATYFVLKENMDIWTFSITFESEPTGSFYSDLKNATISPPVKWLELELTPYSARYETVYCDGINLYLSHYNHKEKYSEVYAIDTFTKEIVYCGNTAPGQLIASIFERNVIRCIDDEMPQVYSDYNNNELTVNTLSSDDQGVSLLRKSAVSISEFNNLIGKKDEYAGIEVINSIANEPVEKEYGTTITPVVSTVIIPPEGVYSDVSVDISYEDAVTNGFITLSYSPSVVVFDCIDSNLKYKAVNVDEENGIIKIVFANGEAIDPATILASVHFKSRQCIHSQVTVVTSEKNDNVHANETETIDIDAQHKWRFGKIEWNLLSSTPKAYVLYTCSECGAPSGYISMTVTKKVKPLWTEYTAYISADDSLDGEAHTSTKKVMKPIIPREWSVLEEKKIVELKPFRP